LHTAHPKSGKYKKTENFRPFRRFQSGIV